MADQQVVGGGDPKGPASDAPDVEGRGAPVAGL
jgi:hypothetical protein